MSVPLGTPVIDEVAEVLATLDEITEADAMSAARIAYAKGYEDAITAPLPLEAPRS